MTVAPYLYRYDWGLIPGSLPALAGGLGLTLQIASLSLALSLLLGLLVALCRMSPFKPLSLLAHAYIQVFRAIAIYVYILWVYFGLAAVLNINFDPLQAAVISLTFLNSAYLAEVYRSSISAVDAGQWEAALAVGLSRVVAFSRVILPQAVSVALPMLVNQYVTMIQDSSLVAVIGAGDLMYTTIRLASYYNRPFEFYTVTGLIYLAVVIVVSRLGTLLERRLKVSSQ